jgi:hypothetical protein
MTLIRVLRRENIGPDDALHRIFTTSPGARGEPDRPDAALRAMRDPPDLDLDRDPDRDPKTPAAIERFKSREDRLRLDWDG